MQFICMINILVPVTAPQTAVTILKMIAGVTIIHEPAVLGTERK